MRDQSPSPQFTVWRTLAAGALLSVVLVACDSGTDSGSLSHAPVTGSTAGLEAPRCAMMADMVSASFLDLAVAIDAQDADTADRVFTRLHALTNTYTALNCDGQAIGEAIDCMMESGNAPAARTRCLAES